MASESSSPQRDPARLRREIERARTDLAQTAGAFRDALHARTDWREWVRRRPGLTLSLAFCFGLWLGTRTD